MPIYRICVSPRTADMDAAGREALAEAHSLDLSNIEGIQCSKLTFLQGDLDERMASDLAAEILCDPVCQEFTVHRAMDEAEDADPSIEIHYRPGVMDPVALSTLEAGRRRLDAVSPRSGKRLHDVRTGRRYRVSGNATAADLQLLATSSLANDCTEAVYIQCSTRRDSLPTQFPEAPVDRFERRVVELRELSGDELNRLSRSQHLFLTQLEMETIRDHFVDLGRDPTDLELETLAQTWSEHCVHKTLKSAVVYRGAPMGESTSQRGGPTHPETGGERPTVEIRYDNLLKDTIVRATTSLARDWCLSVFEDNAGIVAFDDDFGVAFKVETHNHPSALDPYGGAATGIGGCIRDILGCGLGAKPVASTDVFCLAPPDFDRQRLPRGVIHPRRVLKGVVAGVRDYGNRMGIPTVNGAIYFDNRYLGNPLVFCGCVGLIPLNRIQKRVGAGDYVVLVGGRTGRDGIHGATFSSAELTDEHADEFSHAVQIGNPSVEKKVADALLAARDHPDGCLFSSVTDCGAGGLSSAVGEMGEHTGVVVDLEQVPLKYAGLKYDEIWISEAQERMVFSVPPDRLGTLLQVFADEEVEATVIGRFADDGILRIRYEGTLVGELDMRFLHDGVPTPLRTARWHPPATSVPPGGTSDLYRRLLSELATPVVASKEFAFRTYDHEVQGGSVVKPLSGPGQGPSDAAVLRPRLASRRGLALGCGLCPERSDVDPYWMAVAAVDEALRNVICVGGNPARTAILDNFCWGRTDSPEAMGTLVRACQGAHDAAVAYGLPFISGKDSLNNEFVQSEAESARTGLPQRITIPGTLLISAMSMVEDVSQCITMDLKRPGHPLILIRCSAEAHGLKAAARMHSQVAQWIRDGHIVAAHDVSDGGVAVTVAEMCMAGRLGARIRFAGELGESVDELFDTWMGAYVLECADPSVELNLNGGTGATQLVHLGTVDDTGRLEITRGDAEKVTWGLEELGRAWQGSW